jgi:hypothetical protein
VRPTRWLATSAGGLVRQFRGGEGEQRVVDQRKQLVGSARVALLDRRQDFRDVVQEKPDLRTDKPSFFGLPASWYLWSRLGARFWGGVLAGLGVGILVAKSLAELEIPTTGWLRGIAILLGIIGPIIALASVRRSLQAEKDQPQDQ